MKFDIFTISLVLCVSVEFWISFQGCRGCGDHKNRKAPAGSSISRPALPSASGVGSSTSSASQSSSASLSLPEVTIDPPSRPEIVICPIGNINRLPFFYSSVSIRLYGIDLQVPRVQPSLLDALADRQARFTNLFGLQYVDDVIDRAIEVSVNRATTTEDAFCAIRNEQAFRFQRYGLNVKFIGELGADGGGLTRELFSIIARDVVHENFKLFTDISDGNKERFYFRSVENTNTGDILHWYAFLGRMTGYALIHKELFPIPFPDFFYRILIGDYNLQFDDIRSYDQSTYDSLMNLRDNPEMVDVVEIYFSIQRDDGSTADLGYSGGARVTRANLDLYINTKAQFFLFSGVQQQINAFLAGFNQLITPHYLIDFFTPDEIKNLLRGNQNIDVALLRAHFVFEPLTGVTSNHLRVANYFWEVFSNMSDQMKKRLFKHITGMDAMPVSGTSLVMKIALTDGGDTHLPSVHTCSFQIDLPRYSSKEVLARQLVRAMGFSSEFGDI